MIFFYFTRKILGALHASDLSAATTSGGSSYIYAFVTKTKYSGNLGGITGANSKCNEEIPGSIMYSNDREYSFTNSVPVTIANNGFYFGIIHKIQIVAYGQIQVI